MLVRSKGQKINGKCYIAGTAAGENLLGEAKEKQNQTAKKQRGQYD
ncbi:hypothetical protein IH799_07750 [candidate division KSB1 bacterium]|nr:hypothetical protein [candidate division KSB1 bacterium]